MSKHGRDRGYDSSEPSTSGSYRKKPYDRGSDSERSSVRKAVQNIKREDDYAQPSTSWQQSYDEQPMDVKSEAGTESDIKSEIKSEAESSTTVSTRSRRKLEPIFVSRPSNLVTKKGTSGERIMLQSNHFKLPTVPNSAIYQYRVDFEPDESRTFIRKGMLKLHKDRVKGQYIFDGTILYTSTRLPDKIEVTTVRQSDSVPIDIKICMVGKMLPDDPHYNIIFNIIVRKCLEHLRLQLVGRDYYDAKNKVSVHQHKLELWPGYVTSIRQYENDILMCAEISHKVIRQQTLLDILQECYSKNGTNYRTEFCNIVIGMMVLTDYNNHTYRIEDVDFDTTPASTFSMKNEQISYQAYYKNKYSIDIRESTQPMLVTRSKPKQRNAGQGDLVYLVPGLCRPTGLTDNQRENFHLMKALSTHTCVSPAARIDKLMRFNNRLRGEPKVLQELSDWKMSLESNLVQVPARILPSVPLLTGNKLINKSNGHGQYGQHGQHGRDFVKRGDWTRDMQTAQLLNPKVLRNWVVITCDRSGHITRNFINMLMQVSRQISFTVEYPHFERIDDDRASGYNKKLEEVLSKYAPDLIFCIVSNNRNDRYAAIKKKCCLDRPVPTQVFLQKNLNGRNAMSIATKVAIQINCKLGGSPWTIDNNIKGLMTIGFDVCHDANTKGKDFLAMVATVDHKLSRYFSSISLYNSSEDLADQLCSNLCKAVSAYRKYNSALPMYLVIYRDGVSDGQVRQVFEIEVERLKQKLEELYYGPNFKMIFIIVTKRINVRLFRYKDNPPIGTVVDDVITNPLRYDFYLVSQQVRQGTISPTSYNVIYDNTGLDAETIQTLTFKLTHIYYNCSSTVRVPAPCHYAQKLSFLVGRFLHRPPSSQLQSQLFFL